METKTELETLLAQNSVPNLGTEREQIEYIELNKIDKDPRNFYRVDRIDELAANIELLGLQQPIRVRTNPENPERVIIVSGHRRREAILRLAAENPERWEKVPCIREAENTSEALQELRLIYANNDTRRMSPADQSKQAERVEILLYQLKEEGYEFPGRMRDHVAKACQMSKSKLSRLKVIRDGLADCWKTMWEHDKLPEQTAYTLAHFPADFQRRIFAVTKGVVNGLAVERTLEKYKTGWRWENTLSCPNDKACGHADAALSHDLENPFSMCGGQTCCLGCEAAKRSCYPCKRACSKAKKQKEEQNAKKKAKEKELKEQHLSKNRKRVAYQAQRLIKAADEARVPNETRITLSQYGETYTVRELKDFAVGEFGECQVENWTLDPRGMVDVGKIAQTLHCSADYILGLTDELTSERLATNAENTWSEPYQRPDESGLYWCVTGPLKGGGKLLWWNNEEGCWEHPVAADCELRVDVTIWMRCPELPEGMSWNREKVDENAE